MREVLVYKHERIGSDTYHSKVTDGKGYAKFHQFGCVYEEFDDAIGNTSVAIIEREDGSVETVAVDMIKFVDAPK